MFGRLNFLVLQFGPIFRSKVSFRERENQYLVPETSIFLEVDFSWMIPNFHQKNVCFTISIHLNHVFFFGTPRYAPQPQFEPTPWPPKSSEFPTWRKIEVSTDEIETLERAATVWFKGPMEVT